MSGRISQRLLPALRHPVVRNIMALSWVQLATFVIPLVTLPYLSRTLTVSGFGLFVFSQAFSFLLGVLIQYGFDQFSTRETAAARNDPDALAAAVHRVLSAKVMLVMGVTVVAAGASFVVPQLDGHLDLLALAWVAAVANGLVPGWFFVGLERLRLVSVMQLIIRATSAALTFVLVTGRGDAWVAMALYAGGSVLVLGVTTTLVYREVAPRRPDVRTGVDALRAAWPLFLTVVAFTLYTSMNVVLLGLFASTAAVAQFGAAERILRAAILVFGPLTTAVYPRLVFMLSRGERARVSRLVKIIHLLAGLVAIAMVLAVEVTAPTIIRTVYGDGFDEAVPVLRIIIMLIPIGVANSVGGMQLLLLKHDKLVSRIVLRVGLLNIALGSVLAPTLGPQGMAISVVIAEASAAPMALMALRRVASGALAPSTRAEA
jgi:PST family polysaccharide transporter